MLNHGALMVNLLMSENEEKLIKVSDDIEKIEEDPNKIVHQIDENEDDKKEMEYFYQKIDKKKIPPMYEFLQKIMKDGKSKQQRQNKKQKKQQRQNNGTSENEKRVSETKELKIFETIELV